MRKHLPPDRPVVAAVGPDVQPVTDVLGGEQTAHQLVLRPAAVPFRCPQHDAHFPQVGVMCTRYEIHGIIEIDIVVIISIHKIPDVENAAHGKAKRCDARMPESKIGGMITSKATAGRGDTAMTCLLTHAWYDLFQQQLVISCMLPGSLRRRYGLVVPALSIDAVRTIDLYFPVLQEPPGGLDKALVLILVIAALGSGEEDDGIAGVPEDEHFEFPAEGGGMPGMKFFPEIHA